jgi:cation diffusion facilitator family transporter
MIKNSQYKNKALLLSVSGVLLINLILFLVKLSVGLSANSISIYSDAINNLFDCISAVLTLCSFSVLSTGAYAEKAEQLLSFLISCFIGFSGAYFFYSSAERLMYPTPVWYTPKYLILIIVTAAIKLIMSLILRKTSAVYSLKLVRLMATDSALDFCIGCTTVLTLLLSKNGKYAVDALCGIAISIFIFISAVKGIISAVKMLINYKSKEKIEKIESLLLSCENIQRIHKIRFTDGDICIAQVEVSMESESSFEEITKAVKQQTDINIFITAQSGDIL